MDTRNPRSERTAHIALSDTAKLRCLDVMHGEIDRARTTRRRAEAEMMKRSADRAERARILNALDIPAFLKVQAE